MAPKRLQKQMVIFFRPCSIASSLLYNDPLSVQSEADVQSPEPSPIVLPDVDNTVVSVETVQYGDVSEQMDTDILEKLIFTGMNAAILCQKDMGLLKSMQDAPISYQLLDISQNEMVMSPLQTAVMSPSHAGAISPNHTSMLTSDQGAMSPGGDTHMMQMQLNRQQQLQQQPADNINIARIQQGMVQSPLMDHNGM